MSNDYGCFPNLNLASDNNFKDIYCIILITPISNISFSKSNRYSKNISEENSMVNLEFFNNKDKVTKIFSPIFIIHGQNNEKISVLHSKKLIKYINNYYKWFPSYASNQSDILLNYRKNFYIKVSHFINNIDKFKLNTSKVDNQNNSISLLNSNIFIISKQIGVQREENEKIENNNEQNNNVNDSNFTIIKKTDTFNYDISEIE